MVNIRSPHFVLLIISFGVMTILVHIGVVSGFDNSVHITIGSFKLNETILYLLIIFASFGEIIYLILVSIILTIIGRTRKTGMILLITIVMITLITTYLKPIVGHQKPTETIDLNLLPKGYNLERDSMNPSARNFSYPSNHVASITAFTYIVGYSLSKRFVFCKYVIWLLPFSVMVSQLLMYEAYFSDMAGGIIFGLLIAIFMSNIMHLDIPFSRDRFKRR